MQKIILVALLLVSFLVTSCSSEADATQEKAGSELKSDKATAEVVWQDFNAGVAKAEKENKNIIVDFYTDWCHWCKVMDEKTFKNEDVAKKLSERFVTIRLNAEDANSSVNYKGETYTNIELTRAFRVSGFPSLGFMDSKGELITLVPGFVPPETFIHVLGYIDQECYKKQVSFDDYMKEKGECKNQELN